MSQMDRRTFMKVSAAAVAGAATFAVPGFAVRDAQAHALAARRYVALAPGLSDPALQPKFVELAPNALDPGYVYVPDGDGSYTVAAGPGTTATGHLGGDAAIFGYASEAEIVAGGSYLWPGKTFEIAGDRQGISTLVHWKNELGYSHLLPVDTNLHWCYSLPGQYPPLPAEGTAYKDMKIAVQGVPMIPHLHGKDSAFEFDGNPEFFFTPTGVLGPQWFENDLNGFEDPFVYDDNVPAGTLWYHDHALGITRLNVYAGLAGFYIVRDRDDPGNNPRVLDELGLPADAVGIGLPQVPYELAYAIQDRMFTADGQLFYPAYPGDPFYADFIAAPLLPPEFPDDPNNVTGNGGGPTALAEFFGDHMVVNGKLWPTATTGNQPGVEPRHYRMRLLNGCDSRFLAIRFRPAKTLASTDLKGAGRLLPFWVIGSDQGLAAAATQVDSLIIAPGERYDIVIDFAGLVGQRVIMENIANDAPFAGNPRGSRAGTFRDRQTDRIMAFDVTLPMSAIADNFIPANVATAGSAYAGNTNTTLLRTRKVALFEGMDEYGRLQPLLGTAEPAMDPAGNVINWPVNEITTAAGLADLPMEGSIAWHSPTTENPVADVDGHEIWEIYNTTPDAHPVHLHLVNFEILDRQKVKLDVAPQPVIQHNSTTDPLTWGTGFKIVGIKPQGPVIPATGVEKAPKDMVIAYPGEVTRIKVTFDKAGRYVWHCHILSHEDHEMMRVMQVVLP